eukprot:6189128-Pleurochrysis_carterae.AAC.1
MGARNGMPPCRTCHHRHRSAASVAASITRCTDIAIEQHSRETAFGKNISGGAGSVHSTPLQRAYYKGRAALIFG